ncbi:MAG TPA: magnesium transporter, partial [Acidimicrobiales bacterium]|nr:magnesium transporter [Acidimicrobiales bacterium]
WSTLVTDAAGLRQGVSALAVSSLGDLIAGVTLGSATHTLERLPGLLILVPAAIGMRGNIFGALGSRLGTSIHTGTFTLTRRRDTLVGQNVLAAVALTLLLSVALAVLAQAVGSVFGEHTITVADYVVVSVIGGVLSSIVVLALTLAVSAQAANRGWDMDNVAAPLVTAAGDIVTLPALVLASLLVGHGAVTNTLAPVLAVIALAGAFSAWRTKLPIMRRVVVESLPILLIAGTIDLVAGLTIQKRLDAFSAFPALLVLIPPFLEDTGALGGIVASRLASKLHLGTVTSDLVPNRSARDDMAMAFVFAVPTFVFVALSSDLVAFVLHLASPGSLRMVGVSLVGGFLSTLVATLIAYYGSVVTYRSGFDPDNHGIPLITSSMDLVGAMALILALLLFGVHS